MDNNKFQELVLEQFGQLNRKLDEVDPSLDKVNASQVRMENELIKKIRGLYDFMEVQNEANEHIINSLGRLEAKIDVLQMETANIRRIK